MDNYNPAKIEKKWQIFLEKKIIKNNKKNKHT
jgi:hypothetical protein